MNCPHCDADLTGPLIYDTFIKHGDSPEEALRKAEMYGATKTTGTFDLQIGVYSLETDRTESWRCPHCMGEW
jgi:hypothetical protein